jgi:hypothetical protein
VSIFEYSTARPGFSRQGIDLTLHHERPWAKMAGKPDTQSNDFRGPKGRQHERDHEPSRGPSCLPRSERRLPGDWRDPAAGESFPDQGTGRRSYNKCPPPTRVEDTKDTYGTTAVTDPYRWLEDQESKETRAWIDAQDKCTEAALSRLSGRDAITKRLTELYRIDSYGMPQVRNGRYFFAKSLAGQDLNLLYVRRGSSGPDEVLIDPLPWSADRSSSTTIENVSKDGKYLFMASAKVGRTK